MPEAIRIELISRYHNNPLSGYYGIEKTRKLLAWKYYWPILRHNVKAYVKACDVFLASKMVRHKLYDDLQSLPVPTHQWNDLLMDFVTGLPISINWKEDSYDSILVIVDRLIKMVHYEPVKITINALGLAEVTIDVIVRHHGLPHSIVTGKGSFLTLNSRHCSATSLASSNGFLPPFIHKQTGKPSGNTASWRRIFEPLSNSSRMTGLSSCQWPNLLITMQKTQVPVTCLLSWIAAIIRAFFWKRHQSSLPVKNS